MDLSTGKCTSFKKILISKNSNKYTKIKVLLREIQQISEI